MDIKENIKLSIDESLDERIVWDFDQALNALQGEYWIQLNWIFNATIYSKIWIEDKWTPNQTMSTV